MKCNIQNIALLTICLICIWLIWHVKARRRNDGLRYKATSAEKIRWKKRKLKQKIEFFIDVS